jgi:hypothetical protein
MDRQHTSPAEADVQQSLIQSPSLYPEDENDQNRWSRISVIAPQTEQQHPTVSHFHSGFTLNDNAPIMEQPNNQVVFEPQVSSSNSQVAGQMKEKHLDWTIERDLRTRDFAVVALVFAWRISAAAIVFGVRIITKGRAPVPDTFLDKIVSMGGR